MNNFSNHTVNKRFIIQGATIIFLLFGTIYLGQVLNTKQIKTQSKASDETISQEIPVEHIGNRIRTHVLEVALRYDAATAQKLSITSLRRLHTFVPHLSPVEKGYSLVFIDSSGIKLSSYSFDPPITGHDDGHQNTGTITLSVVDFAITIPIPTGAVSIELRDPSNNSLASQSVQNLNVKEVMPNLSALKGINVQSADTQTSTQAGDQTVNLLFFSSGYTDQNHFISDVENFKSGLLQFEPFKSRNHELEFFNFYTNQDFGCTYPIPNNSAYLQCDSSKAIMAANNSGYPYDSINILVNGFCGGSGSGITVAGNSCEGFISHRIFVHEFGHTFASLRDEYVHLGQGEIPYDNYPRKNCYAGIPPYQPWNGIVSLSDYKFGCGVPNWYRTSETSIMRDLASDQFNALSQKLLNEQMNVFLSRLANLTTSGSINVDVPRVINRQILVYFTLINTGVEVADPVQYQYTAQADGSSSLSSANTCTPTTRLAPGESCISAYLFTFPTAGSKTLSFRIDSIGAVPESNENDNRFSVTFTVETPTPTNTPIPSSTPTITPTRLPTVTPTQLPTPSITSTPTPIAPSPTRTPTPFPSGSTILLHPAADAFVKRSSSSTNYGTSTKLEVDADAGVPTAITFLKFNVSQIVGSQVKSARLKLYVVNSSSGSQRLNMINNSDWTETGITYKNSIGYGRIPLSTINGGRLGTTLSLDVTSAVKTNAGRYVTFAIDSIHSDGLDFSSREGSTKPVLEIIY